MARQANAFVNLLQAATRSLAMVWQVAVGALTQIVVLNAILRHRAQAPLATTVYALVTCLVMAGTASAAGINPVPLVDSVLDRTSAPVQRMEETVTSLALAAENCVVLAQKRLIVSQVNACAPMVASLVMADVCHLQVLYTIFVSLGSSLGAVIIIAPSVCITAFALLLMGSKQAPSVGNSLIQHYTEPSSWDGGAIMPLTKARAFSVLGYQTTRRVVTLTLYCKDLDLVSHVSEYIADHSELELRDDIVVTQSYADLVQALASPGGPEMGVAITLDNSNRTLEYNYTLWFNTSAPAGSGGFHFDWAKQGYDPLRGRMGNQWKGSPLSSGRALSLSHLVEAALVRHAAPSVPTAFATVVSPLPRPTVLPPDVGMPAVPVPEKIDTVEIEADLFRPMPLLPGYQAALHILPFLVSVFHLVLLLMTIGALAADRECGIKGKIQSLGGGELAYLVPKWMFMFTFANIFHLLSLLAVLLVAPDVYTTSSFLAIYLVQFLASGSVISLGMLLASPFRSRDVPRALVLVLGAATSLFLLVSAGFNTWTTLTLNTDDAGRSWSSYTGMVTNLGHDSQFFSHMTAMLPSLQMARVMETMWAIPVNSRASLFPPGSGDAPPLVRTTFQGLADVPLRAYIGQLLACCVGYLLVAVYFGHKQSAKERTVVYAKASKTFHRNQAVRQLSLTMLPNQVFCLLGPNGAGKTTAMDLLLGVHKATSGHVFIHGRDVARDPSAAASLISVCEQDNLLWPHLSPREHLMFFGLFRGLRRSALKHAADSILEQICLADFPAAEVGTLSGGMRRRLCVGIAFMDPKAPVVVLDEPTTGIDPLSRRSIWLGPAAAVLMLWQCLAVFCPLSPSFLVRHFGQGYRIPVACTPVARGYLADQLRALFPTVQVTEGPSKSLLVHLRSQDRALIPTVVQVLSRSSDVHNFGVMRTTLEDVFIHLSHTMHTINEIGATDGKDDLAGSENDDNCVVCQSNPPESVFLFTSSRVPVQVSGKVCGSCAALASPNASCADIQTTSEWTPVPDAGQDSESNSDSDGPLPDAMLRGSGSPGPVTNDPASPEHLQHAAASFRPTYQKQLLGLVWNQGEIRMAQRKANCCLCLVVLFMVSAMLGLHFGLPSLVPGGGLIASSQGWCGGQQQALPCNLTDRLLSMEDMSPFASSFNQWNLPPDDDGNISQTSMDTWCARDSLHLL
eukprot:gene10432-278_t